MQAVTLPSHAERLHISADISVASQTPEPLCPAPAVSGFICNTLRVLCTLPATFKMAAWRGTRLRPPRHRHVSDGGRPGAPRRLRAPQLCQRSLLSTGRHPREQRVRHNLCGAARRGARGRRKAAAGGRRSACGGRRTEVCVRWEEDRGLRGVGGGQRSA